MKLSRRHAWWPVAALLATWGSYAAIYLPLLKSPKGRIGGDYYYFFPRLVAGYYWKRVNGPFAIPWFTPGLCGGLPVFGNPQGMPFSVPQYLTMIVGPWGAVVGTLLIFSAIGLVGTYLLLRGPFRASREAALLGATLFLFNGFFSERMIVGHLAFHAFTLVPVIALLMCRSSRAPLIDICGAGLLITVMIQGGMDVILVPAVLGILALGLLFAARGGSWRSFGVRYVFGGLLGAALSAMKLEASFSLLSHLRRDMYRLPGIASPWLLVKTAFEALFFAVRSTSSLLSNADVRLPLHEWSYSLTPVALLMLVAGAVFVVRRRGSLGRWRFLLPLVLVMLLPLALNLYTPTWNAVLKSLPILKSSSSLVRWLIIDIPVIAVASGLALDVISTQRFIRSALLLASMIAVFIWCMAIGRGGGRNYLRYNPSRSISAWHIARDSGRVPSVEYVEAIPDMKGGVASAIGYDEELTLGASHAYCYEPLFGYGLEKLSLGVLHSGAILDAVKGRLNLKNPACYEYPVENRCAPGDEFLASQRNQAMAFASYHPFRFQRSRRQQAAAVVNLVALFFVAGVFALGLVRALRKERGERPKASPL